MMRGADRRILFSDDEDCLGFIQSLRHAKEYGKCELYAYCLMGNHVHLLIKEGEEPLENVIKRLGVSYVYHYNRKYELRGHLFQDRFRSEPIDTEAYFMDVLRYICQNPVKAGLAKDPQGYRWLGCAGIRDTFQLTDWPERYTQLNREELQLFVSGPCESEHLEATDWKRLTDREATEKICDCCGCRYAQEIEGWPAARQEEAVLRAIECGISIRQLSRLTGISKAVIERINRAKE